MNPAALEALGPLMAAKQATPTAQSLQSIQSGALPSLEPAGAGQANGAFGHMVSSGLSAVNGQLLNTQTDLQQLAMGAAPSLHRVMMDLEETRLSFQLLVQVRNRLLEAYQDVMKMQV